MKEKGNVRHHSGFSQRIPKEKSAAVFFEQIVRTGHNPQVYADRQHVTTIKAKQGTNVWRGSNLTQPLIPLLASLCTAFEVNPIWN